MPQGPAGATVLTTGSARRDLPSSIIGPGSIARRLWTMIVVTGHQERPRDHEHSEPHLQVGDERLVDAERGADLSIVTA